MSKRRRRAKGSGGLRQKTPGAPYTAIWYDWRGKRRWRSTGTNDLQAATLILNKWASDAALFNRGVGDAGKAESDEAAAAPIRRHIQAFRATLQSRGRKVKHITQTIKYIETLAAESTWGNVGDIKADDVTRCAARLRAENKSARTIQAVLTAAKQFTRWLTVGGKLTRDPLAGIVKPNPKTDRRRRRRFLLPDEWPRLESAALNGGERWGMVGEVRAVLYAVAIQTGLRSGELRALTQSALKSDASGAFIHALEGSTKNAKWAKQYIDGELAKRLRAIVARKIGKAPIFPMPDSEDVAEMLRADLADARAAWIDEAQFDPDEMQKRRGGEFLAGVNHDGERLDFHSLRHTCGAWAAMAGASPKAVQSLMRHEDIRLTFNTYGHLFPGEAVGTVARLAAMMRGPASAAATAVVRLVSS